MKVDGPQFSADVCTVLVLWIKLESVRKAQAAALKSFAHNKANCREKRAPQKREKSSGRRLHHSAMPQLPAESRPVNQIARNSYIGAALRNVG